jgi:hypothetical protein
MEEVNMAVGYKINPLPFCTIQIHKYIYTYKSIHISMINIKESMAQDIPGPFMMMMMMFT